MADTTVQLPQLNPYPLDTALDTDLFFCWNSAAGELQYVTRAQLLGVIPDPAPAPVVLASPFQVFNYSPTYAYVDGNTVITDMRLLDKTGYIVRNTKFQTDFKPSQLVFDPVAGSVTIAGFELDDADDYISIYVDGSISTYASLSYKALSDRIDANDAMLIIFKPTALGGTGAIIPWYKPLDQIPIGWSPVANIAGRVMVNIDPTNPLFDTIFKKAGSATHTNTIAEMPAHAHKQGGESLYDDYHDDTAPDNGTFVGNRTYTPVNVDQGSYRNQKTNKQGGGQAWNIMNPYVVVCYIEYTGI